MRVIYLSAHLDDAILSCGGMIKDQTQSGKSVEIWTLFTEVQDGKPADSYLMRMQEDREACEFLGAKYLHLGHKDAFGRGYKDVFEPLTPSDEYYIKNISPWFKTMIQPDDMVMCPLAVGHHVDHLFVRKVAERIGCELYYYVDFPYVEYKPQELGQATDNLVILPISVSRDSLEDWIGAVLKYKSQNFYDTPEITTQKIREHWLNRNGSFTYRNKNRQEIFAEIYSKNQWKGEDSVSGPGSSMEETENIRQQLPLIISKYNITSMLDIPCGDFAWMRSVPVIDTIEYIGADIVESLISDNVQKYQSETKKFVVMDIVDTPLPKCDLVFCRDCLGHLSTREVVKAIQNIITSGSHYFMATNFPQAKPNWDIETGKWRPINLEMKPYEFPVPLLDVDELVARSIEVEHGFKYMSLWKISDLKRLE